MVLLLVLPCCAMEGDFRGGAGVRDTRGAVKPKAFGTEIKYLKCPVCKVAAASLVDAVTIQRDKDPKTQLGDEKLIEMVEKACNPYADEGEWILRHDYERSEDKTLQLNRHDSYGKCNRECETIQQACDAVVGAYDTDIADALYRKKSVEELTALMCHRGWVGQRAPCQGKHKMKKERMFDETFEAISVEDHQTEKLMRSMGEMGMGGQIFNQDMLGDIGGRGGDGDDGGIDELGDLGGMALGREHEKLANESFFGLLPITEWPWFSQLAAIAAVVLLAMAIVLPDDEASEAEQLDKQSKAKASTERNLSD